MPVILQLWRLVWGFFWACMFSVFFALLVVFSNVVISRGFYSQLIDSSLLHHWKDHSESTRWHLTYSGQTQRSCASTSRPKRCIWYDRPQLSASNWIVSQMNRMLPARKRTDCFHVRTPFSKYILEMWGSSGLSLGPLLFSIYKITLARIIRRHGISYHLYADDTQLYMKLICFDNPTTQMTYVGWRDV